MSTIYGLGPMPGTSIAHAASMIDGETTLRHIPLLPQRGLTCQAVAYTVAHLEGVYIERGPRSWRLCPRPSLLSRQARDQVERDRDALEAAWSGLRAPLKQQFLGPWTLSARLELSSGHRVLTDRYALADLRAALAGAAAASPWDIQLDEPDLGLILGGNVPAPTAFHAIDPVPAERVAAALKQVGHQWLNLAGVPPRWWRELCLWPQTLIVDAMDLDAAAQRLDAGLRLGVVEGHPAALAHEVGVDAEDLIDVVKRDWPA